jgi:hypothetical protein
MIGIENEEFGRTSKQYADIRFVAPKPFRSFADR